ncbi:MAG: nitroreductase [Oligosphaeraceae bacterium]
MANRNEALERLLDRRSVKAYRPDPVPQELLDEILAAGMNAPTGMNRQSPIILAVTDRKVRDELSRRNAAAMGMSGVDPFYGAPAVLVVLARKDVVTHVYDGSLVLGQMLVAAHSLGLGACWIHRAKEVFESSWGRELLRSLGVEGEYEGIGHCIVGYPDGPLPAARPRKENYVYYIKG